MELRSDRDMFGFWNDENYHHSGEYHLVIVRKKIPHKPILAKEYWLLSQKSSL
jgi:hypothetical protein